MSSRSVLFFVREKVDSIKTAETLAEKHEPVGIEFQSACRNVSIGHPKTFEGSVSDVDFRRFLIQSDVDFLRDLGIQGDRLPPSEKSSGNSPGHTVFVRIILENRRTGGENLRAAERK